MTVFYCDGALKTFQTNWSQEPSVLNLPQSNLIAGRAVKLMEELKKMQQRPISHFKICSMQQSVVISLTGMN